MKRLFFALDINDEDKKAIIHWRQKHLDNVMPIKHSVAESNLHITLAFLGTVNQNQQDIFIEYCNDIFHPLIPEYINELSAKTSFELSLNTLQLFKKPKVLYLGFNSFPSTLTSFAEGLSTKAKKQGLFQENRSYCPHISIARKIKALTITPSLNIPLKVSSFSLYHSQSTTHGVVYSPLNAWSLVLK